MNEDVDHISVAVPPGLSTELEGTSDRLQVLRDIIFLPLEDRIVIDGMAQTETVRGVLAQTVLPDLLRLLDGTRTLEQLVNAFPSIPSDYVCSAVSMLNAWGMLQNVADRTDPPGSNPETMAFLRRRIGSAGTSRYSACEAYQRLQDAEVFLVGTNESSVQSEGLRVLLQESGVGSISVAGRDSFDHEDVPAHALVVSLSKGRDDLEWYARLDDLKSKCGFVWLRATLDGEKGIADSGPLFGPEDSRTCYRCFRSVHAGTAEVMTPDESSLDHDRLWASLLALEVMDILALPNSAPRSREFRRFRIHDWGSSNLFYPRLPGCPVCRPKALFSKNRHSDQRSGRDCITDTALVFEEQVGLESRALLSPNARAEFAHANVVYCRESKKLPNCEQVWLRRGDVVLEADTLQALLPRKPGPTATLTVDNLTAMLAMTAGFREFTETKVRRWAATAGNLGSVELFVAVRSVDGLKQGIYLYQPEEHTLALFRKRGEPEIDEFICRVLARDEDDLPDALVIFCGAFHRLARKYGSFAYRLVNLDAGSALSQLHLVARSFNIWSRTAVRWADTLIEDRLNLNRFEEQTTVVLELSTRKLKTPGIFSFLKPSRKRPFDPRSWKTAQEVQSLNVRQLAQIVFEESRMKETDLRLGRCAVTHNPWIRDRSRSSTVRLPKPGFRGLSVGSVLAKRRSVREYSQQEIPPAYVGTALRCAHDADAIDWPDEHSNVPLTYVVLAKGIVGIAPGVYEYEPRAHSLIFSCPPLPDAQTVELLVQPEYAYAPIIVWIAGDLAAACARHGALGHRQLLLRAGASGHRLWMATIALGLAGSIFAGLIPGAARRLLGMDGYERASLFAFAAGYSKDST